MTQDECRVAVCSYRDRLKKARVDLELNLRRDVKSNKGFYKYLSSKSGANVGLLLNGPGKVVTNDMAKVKVLSAAFTSGFASKTSLQESLGPETHGKVFSLPLMLSFVSYCPCGAASKISHPSSLSQTSACSNQI